MKTRITALLTVIFLFTGLLTTQVSAALRASEQIRDASVSIQAYSSGEIAVEFKVNGTGSMSKLGTSSISLYEYYNGYWRSVQTITPSQRPGMTTTNAYSHTGTEYFSGVAGRQYYASVTVFATDSQGTDYRTYTTGTVTAK